MKLRSLVIILALIFVTFAISGCGCTRINPGFVGIKINLSGSDRGVDDLPIETGWVFYMPGFSQVVKYPTFVQTAAWTRDVNEGSPTNEEVSFNSKEGLIITGDISLSYQLDPKFVPKFYTKFRSDDLKLFTHGYLRNIARDAFNEVSGGYSVEDLYGPKKEEILIAVRKRISEQLKDIGISLQQFGFIGAPRPPQNVVEALNQKVAATQQAMQSDNELRKAEAEAKKKVAEANGTAEARIAEAKGTAESNIIEAEAQAKSNRIIAASITSELIRYQSVEKWNGALPQVTSGATPMIQLGTK